MSRHVLSAVGFAGALAVFAAFSACGAPKVKTVTQTVTIGASACRLSSSANVDARNFTFGLSAASDVDTTRRGLTIIIR